MPATETTTSAPDGNLAAVLARLEDPHTAAALFDLIDNLGTLSGLLEVVQSFLSRSEEILDNAASSMRETVAATAGTPIARMVPQMIKIGGQTIPLVGQLADHDVIARVAQSPLLDPDLFDLLETVLVGVQRAKAQLAEPIAGQKPGALHLLSAMKDPDVSRGIDFTMVVMRELGRSLVDTPATGSGGAEPVDGASKRKKGAR